MSERSGRLGTPNQSPERQERALAVDTPGARWLRRYQAASVAALTTTAGEFYRAALINAVVQVSTAPILYFVSLEEDSRILGAIQDSGVFGLSFLDRSQQFLADRLAGFAPLVPPRFEGIDYVTAETGSPLLHAALGWADCRVTSEITTGDHVNIIGEVVALGRGVGSDPLIYYDNRYRPLR